jgi:hypothetical protein
MLESAAADSQQCDTALELYSAHAHGGCYLRCLCNGAQTLKKYACQGRPFLVFYRIALGTSNGAALFVFATTCIT